MHYQSGAELAQIVEPLKVDTLDHSTSCYLMLPHVYIHHVPHVYIGFWNILNTIVNLIYTLQKVWDLLRVVNYEDNYKIQSIRTMWFAKMK